jgi:hypothetical protein
MTADLGYSEPTIAVLVGHVHRGTTSRYIHSADAVLLAATSRILALMGERKSRRRCGRNTAAGALYGPSRGIGRPSNKAGLRTGFPSSMFIAGACGGAQNVSNIL